jgi:hypothetical protein
LRVNDQIFQIGEVNVRNMSSEQVASILRQPNMHGQVVKFIVARPVHNTGNDVDQPTPQLETPSSTNNGQCFTMRTAEIMDKSLNLTHRVAFEADKYARQHPEEHAGVTTTSATVHESEQPVGLTTTETVAAQLITEQPQTTAVPPTTHEPQSTVSDKQPATEPTSAQAPLQITSEFSIELDLTTATSTTVTYAQHNDLISWLNDELTTGQHNLTFDSTANDDSCSEFLVFVAAVQRPCADIRLARVEPYDQLVEVNGVPVSPAIHLATLRERVAAAGRKLVLKLDANFAFKSLRLERKWRGLLARAGVEFSGVSEYIEYELIISRIDKSTSRSLGISLEGTVDVDEAGNETCPHHYIRSVMSGGPVDRALDSVFKPGDELLEIDFTRLFTINHLDLLNILKSLSSRTLVLVCVRRPNKPSPTLELAADVSQAGGGSVKRAKSESHLEPKEAAVAAALAAANMDAGAFINRDEELVSAENLNKNDEATAAANTKTTEVVVSLVNGHKQQSPPLFVAKSTPSIANGGDESRKLSVKRRTKIAVNESFVTKRQRQVDVKNPPRLCVRSRSLELSGLALWNKQV